MSHLDILIPFGFPPAAMAADLLRALKTPALATLVARAQAPRIEQFDPFSRALPHEFWLARQFGLDGNMPHGGSLSVAWAAMQAFGLTPDEGCWFMLQPVHIHISSKHLVLTDLRQLALSEPDSQALFDIAKPLFDEGGKSLIYGDAHTWFVRADEWADLHTSTPDATCGHNIDIWMPEGSGERDWRKLQNEVQMHWHAHHEQRGLQHLKPVNSVWLWGGAASSMPGEPGRYTHAFNLSGWMKACAQFAGIQTRDGSAQHIIAAAAAHGLLVLDTLMAPALAQDWSDWITRMQALEVNWFAPVLAALQAGALSEVSLVLTHKAMLSEFTVTKNSLRKFWVKPTLTRLLP